MASQAQGELQILLVTGQPPSLVRDHINSLGLVAESTQCAERFKPSTQRPQHTDLYWTGEKGYTYIS